MASTVFPGEVARRHLDEDGFFDLEDTAIGEYIWQMERRRFPLVSEYGIGFYRQRVLGDKRINTIIGSVLGRCLLAHWLRYKANPGHIVSFRAGGPKAGRHSLLVHLWAKGSRVEYYGGSHLHKIPKMAGDRLLWETEAHNLAEAGCKATPKEFPSGGIVILDARIDYEIKDGYAITFEFATNHIIDETWPKLQVPAALESMVKSVQSDIIGVNYEVIQE